MRFELSPEAGVCGVCADFLRADCGRRWRCSISEARRRVRCACCSAQGSAGRPDRDGGGNTRTRAACAAGYSAALALAALAGLGVALHHVWVLYHPKFGCGIDALEQFVNNLPTAKLLPWLFHASGDCTAAHEPVLGLQVPEWSLIWFALLLVARYFSPPSVCLRRAPAPRIEFRHRRRGSDSHSGGGGKPL